MELYIARHGQTFSNIGQDPSDDAALTPMGLRQVELLGERMALIPLDGVFASPLQRAVQTAQAVVSRQPKHLPVELMPDLVEYGTAAGYPGKPLAELQALCPGAVRTDFSTVPQETPEQALERAKRVIARLRERFPGETDRVFIAAHGNFNNYLLLAAVNAPVKPHFNFSQYNGCLNLVRYITWQGEPHTQFTYFNSFTHIPPELITGT